MNHSSEEGKQKVLVLDVSALAYRSIWVMGDLRDPQGQATGALYGLFRELLGLMDIHGVDVVAFCFDGGSKHRKDIFPQYKESRKLLSEEEKLLVKNLACQLKRLREDILVQAGMENIFFCEGYEADDLIASLVLNRRSNQEIIIVSSDNDLFQLLAPGVWLKRAKDTYTHDRFMEEWGIAPFLWADVKAIAGCSSDGVIGIRGIGEKTAVKYLVGSLPRDSKAYRLIEENRNVWQFNLPIVRLPMLGTPVIRVGEKKVRAQDLIPIFEMLGMDTLVQKVSRGRRVRVEGEVLFGGERDELVYGD